MPACSGVRSALRALHGSQAATQLVQIDAPPRERGTTWSTVICAQPGWEAITVDHVVPRSQGGASSWTNCVAACVRCNALKADRTPEQAGMKLRRRPVRPEWKPLYAAHGVRVESWARFLPHEPALLLA